MKQEASHPVGPGLDVRHRKPRRLAQKFENYIGAVMAVAGLVLLAVLAYGVMNTGSGTPSWMH